MTAGEETDELRCEINVTPLVDVMLVLLVIFMVVTPLLRLEVPIELPRAESAVAAPPDAEQITLLATADGTLRLADRRITRDELTPVLREIYAARTNRSIFLEADGSLSYATVVALMDICRKAGVERIGVVTSPPAAREPAAQ